MQIGILKRVRLIDKRAVSDQFLKKFGAYIDRKVIEVENLSHIEAIIKGIEE